MDRQPHRIIVEGMDGSGKTTLIHQLETIFPKFEIVTRPQGRSFNDWWPEELDRSVQKPVPLHDRFFYSELVYGPILRKELAAPQALVDNVAWFLRHVAMLVYCRPSSQLIYKNVDNGDHIPGVRDNATALLSSYDHMMAIERAWYGKRFFHYNYEEDKHFDRLVMAIEDYLGA